MELVYLWVEKYKNIHKQGFNFSPRFECKFHDKYDEEGKLKDGCELDIQPKEHIENFFGENINVTAIVGKNGSGKSRILEIITLFRFERLKEYLENKNILIVFKNKNKLYIPYSYNDSFFGESFKSFDLNYVINNTNLEVYSKENISYKYLYWLTLFTNGLSDFTEGQNRLRGHNFQSFYNGSDNYEEDGENEEYVFYKKFSILLKGNANIFKILGEDFIFDSMYIELNLTKFIFSIDDDMEELKEIKYFFKSNIDNHSITSGEPKKEITKEIVIYNFLVSDFLLKYINILIDPPGNWNREKVLKMFFTNELMPQINRIIEQCKKEKDNNMLPSYLELILELIKKNYNSYKKILYEKFKEDENEYFKGQIKELEFIYKYKELVEYIINNFELDDKTLKLKTPINIITQEKVASFYQLFVKKDFYKELHLSGRLCFNFIHSQKNHISFNSLSTGEKQLLKFITNLTYTLIDTKYENRMILLDEIETAFHPQWQKKFISIVINFIHEIKKRELIPKENEYHLIFVTHSPFILSDIPIENIIFLDKYKNEDKEVLEKTQLIGNCKVVDGLNKKQQTFGANIHTLLSDSFFMQDGLMGEFAKNKIQEIMDFHKEVEKENSDKEALKTQYLENQKKFWQTQSIVGEAYLKQVLENHLIEIEKLLLGKDGAKLSKKERLLAQLKELDND